MTDSNDGSSGADGGDGDEAIGADENLGALQSVSTSLRSAQHGGREAEGSSDVAEDQADDDVPAADPDGLDEPVPVASELRSAQSRAGAGDTDAADDGGEASDGEECGDD